MNRFATLLACAVRPLFLKAGRMSSAYHSAGHYRRMWGIACLLLGTVALVPLVIMTIIDFQLTERAIHSEHVLRTVRVTSNTRRTVSYFLEERLAALRFTLREESFEDLRDEEHLHEVLKNLKVGFGGFIDLGVIDERGVQIAYVGPFDLSGRDYRDQRWFRQVREEAFHVSDVFMGFREEPHMIIAVRSLHGASHGESYILRATLDIRRLIQMLATLELGSRSDAFLVNRQGVIQTPSKFYGDVLSPARLPMPPYSKRTSYVEVEDNAGRNITIGYAYIEDSPFVLFITRSGSEAMQVWFDLRLDMLWFLVGSIIAILIVVYVLSTYMTNKIFRADMQQGEAMQHMENTSRLASIGRLAAGVAHEINNPLAIINEKAGLIRDLLVFKACPDDPTRLVGHIDSVIDAVDRCGNITKQLLDFARNVELRVEPLDLGKVARDVLSFVEKEAEYRNIEISLQAAENLPAIRSDRGKLQQILLNLITNAMQAMTKNGRLEITIRAADSGDGVEIMVADTGVGIPGRALKKIFDPFYTTKKSRGGSGLGLSITYGLVRELEGAISVQSEPGKGTTFTISLPLAMHTETEDQTNDQDSAG